MTSEVRKVLNSCVISSKVRDRLDAAERADAAKREVSFVVECKRCGQSTCTSPEYSAVCGCGAVFKLHRHNQQADAAKHEESVQGLRQKVAELVARYSRYTLPYSAIMVRYIIADLNAIIATEPDPVENRQATASGPVLDVTPVTVQQVREIVAEKISEMVDSLTFINDLGAYDDLKDPCAEMLRTLKSDREFLADAYLAEHAPKPLEAYLEFANVLCVEEAGLGYDAAVAVAKAMHKRGMVIPNE